jgi:hypothetical protein
MLKRASARAPLTQATCARWSPPAPALGRGYPPPGPHRALPDGPAQAKLAAQERKSKLFLARSRLNRAHGEVPSICDEIVKLQNSAAEIARKIADRFDDLARTEAEAEDAARDLVVAEQDLARAEQRSDGRAVGAGDEPPRCAAAAARRPKAFHGAARALWHFLMQSHHRRVRVPQQCSPVFA